MTTNQRRLDRLEDAMPRPVSLPDLTPEGREYVQAITQQIDRIVDTLLADYKEAVTVDLDRMGRTPQPYPIMPDPLRGYWVANVIRSLTFAVVEMAGGIVSGWYTGPARFPLVVCEAFNHYSSDNPKSHVHGHVKPPPFRDDECPSCGFFWPTHKLRDTLDTCPACELVWPPVGSGQL
jgi:hypothetical protein